MLRFLLAVGLVSAQSLSFEVVSIKPSGPKPTSGKIIQGPRLSPGRMDMEFTSLQSIIQNAYRVMPYQVLRPDWLASEHFDVHAKLPDGAERDQLPELLRVLLAERFQFTAHRETRTMPIYALVIVGDGSKIHAATSEDNRVGHSNGPQGHRVWGRFILANLINAISWSVDRPILDMTGRGGDEAYFDIDLRWSDEGSATEAPLLSTALRETLGLKLEPRKGPVDVR
jgi:uncharacterized protein (TIGR03435 family)